MGFDLIYLGFGLLVKVEVIILLTYQHPKKVRVLLGEVKLKSHSMSVLLYSNKLELINKTIEYFEY